MRKLLRGAMITGVAVLPLMAFNSASAQRQDAAQQQRETQQRQQQQRQQQQGQVELGEKQLIDWLMTLNQGEIEIAKWAQEKTEHPEVQSFAEKMVQEHTQLQQKLQQLSPQGQQGRQGQQSRQGQQGQQDQQAQRQPQQQPREAQRPEIPGRERQPGAQQGGSGKVEFSQLLDEIQSGMLKSIQSELGQKRGKEFDKAFLGQQIASHLATEVTYQTFQKHAASPQFKQLLQQTLPTIEQHKRQAEQLMRQVDQGSTQRQQNN